MFGVGSTQKYEAEIKGEMYFQISKYFQRVFSSNLCPIAWENLLHLFWRTVY